MKKNYTLRTRIALLAAGLTMAFSFNANAQLTGLKTIPGDYATIAAAVTDLNSQGVGATGVTFNIAAGYTETITAPISITATGTVSSPIVFQRDGAGTNPLITAYIGTATPASAVQDGIWNLVGSDYVSIFNIDLVDPNTTNPATMEYGFALFKSGPMNGCQNNVIQGCTVTLSRNNNATGAGPSVEGSKGINIVNASFSAQATTLTTTSSTGANSNNKLYNNTIQNCNYGIVIIGFADVTPFANADMNNEIGGSVSTGNTILNFGGAAAATNPSAGIRTLAQYNFLVTYNTVNNNNGSGVNHPSTLRGIYVNTATSASASITYNTVTLSSGATTSLVQAISNASGSTAAGNTINITNNLVQNCTYPTATGADFNGIINTGTAATVNVNNNTVAGNVLPGTGVFTGIDGGGGTNVFLVGNTVVNNTKTGASGSMFCIRGGTSILTFDSNIVNNNGLTATSGTSSGSVHGLYSFSSPTGENFINNSVTNLYISGSSTSNLSVINGINTNSIAASNKVISGNQINSFQFNNSSTGVAAVNGIVTVTGNMVGISKNKIYNLLATGSGSSVSGIRVTSGTTVTLSNNLIGDIKTPTANGANLLNGINITGGTTVNVYYNTVQLNGSSTGTDFGSSAIFASSTPTVELRNNIFLNGSSPNGTGSTVAYRRSTTTLTTYSNNSNNNIFFAGTPAAANLIFFDGTNADQSLGAFQTRVGPTRDAASRTENVSFISLAGSSPSFLHVNTAIPTYAESGALNISPITDDYDSEIRFGNPGYIGTGTAPDIGADEFEGIAVAQCAGTPVAGNISGASVVCSGTGTTLSLTGGATEPGISYQWQSSSTPGGPYTNMGTTTSQATGSLTAPMYYIVTTTCSFSGLSSSTAEHAVNINSNPTVSITPPAADFCIGGSPIALSASGASTYVWTPAAGLSATTGSAVNATPSLTTTYTVTGTDANGCIATATSAITANEIPSLSSVTATPSSVCSGGNSQLMATATTTSSYVVQPATYNLETPAGTATNIFTTGDDAISPSIAIPFPFNFFGQTFNNVFVSTNGFIQLGANSGTSYGAPIPTAAVPNNVIAGIWDDLNVTGAGSPVVRYFTNGTAPNRKFIIEYSAVKFYNSAANNGNASFQIKLFEGSNVVEVHLATAVDPTPSAHYLGIENGNGTLGYSPAGRNPFSTDITVPEAWAFMPNGGSITYVWSPATFLSSTTVNNPMANGVTATTTYTVTATSATCSTSSTVTITSGSALTSSSNITPASAVCLGTTVTLNAVPSGGGAPYTFAWSGPAGFSSTAQNPSFPATMAEAGTYTVTVTDNCSATSTSTVTLSVNGLPTVSVTPSTATYCMSGTAVALSASGTSTSYAWLPAAGLSAATGANVDASPTATTTYTVTGTDGNGCTATATASVTSAPAVSVGTVTASPATLCAGSNSNLMASASLVPAAYCSATTTSTSFEKISNVTFGTINNTSSATAGYENFTAMSTNITAGVAVPISMGISSAYATDDRVHVWIDMNNDGVFANPSENVLNLAISTFCPTCSGTATTINGTITVPVTALNGLTRMRIRLQDASAGVNNSTPCGVAQYGQVEDYSVNISGAADNGITYSWAPATYLSSTSISNPVATAVANNISYTVTATSTDGCSATGSTSITVNQLPSIMAMSNDADNTICAGSSITLSGMGAVSYSWTGGVTDGTPFTPTSTNTYTVTGTDANGCVNTATATVTVNPLPSVMAMSNDADNTLCAGSSITLSGMGAVSYSWTGGVVDGSAFTPTSTNTYTVTGTDANGCMNTATATVTVNPLPTIMAMSNDADNTICAGSSITLSGMGAVSYSWTGGVTDATPFTPTATDTYTVTGTDANGCMNTATTTVTVNSLPSVMGMSNDMDNAICTGSSVTLTGMGAVSYTWTGGVTDGSSFTPTATDTYTVTGTDANGCMNTSTVTITVNSLPTVTAMSDDTDNTICAGSMITLSGMGATTYTWTGGVSDATSFVPTATDTYTVTGTDANGCMNTNTITVTVNTLPAVSMSAFGTSVCDNGGPVSLSGGSPAGGMYSGTGVSGATFDPTGLSGMYLITYTVTDVNSCSDSDTASIMVDICSGIASNTESTGVKVYPNPASGMVNVSIAKANSDQITISIVDIQGKQVYNETTKNIATEFNTQINIESLAKGVYYIKVTTDNNTQIHKLIVH